MDAERVCERMSLCVRLALGTRESCWECWFCYPSNAECPSMFVELSERGKGNGMRLCSHKLPNVCMVMALSAKLCIAVHCDNSTHCWSFTQLHLTIFSVIFGI